MNVTLQRSRAMNSKPLTIAQKCNAAGLILFGLSIPVQLAMGIKGYPPIPPGIFVSIGAAVLIMLNRWHWTVYLGFMLPVGLLAASFIFNWAWLDTWADPAAGGYPGFIMQAIGLVLALVSGAVVLLQKIRKS
jgi:hypothetical protein